MGEQPRRRLDAVAKWWRIARRVAPGVPDPGSEPEPDYGFTGLTLITQGRWLVGALLSCILVASSQKYNRPVSVTYGPSRRIKDSEKPRADSDEKSRAWGDRLRRPGQMHANKFGSVNGHFRACQSTVTDVTCRLPRSALCPLRSENPAPSRAADGRPPAHSTRASPSLSAAEQNVYREDATSRAADTLQRPKRVS